MARRFSAVAGRRHFLIAGTAVISLIGGVGLLFHGARDMVQWTSMQLDVSRWKAERWVSRTGHRLERLPATRAALERGNLVMCSARLAGDADQDRTTIVVHADLETPRDVDGNATLEGGSVIAGTTLQRLLCNARVETVMERFDGSVAARDRASREPSP